MRSAYPLHIWKFLPLSGIWAYNWPQNKNGMLSYQNMLILPKLMLCFRISNKKTPKATLCQEYFSITILCYSFIKNYLFCYSFCYLLQIRFTETVENIFMGWVNIFLFPSIRYFLHDFWLQRGDGLWTIWSIPPGSSQTTHSRFWRPFIRLHRAVSKVLFLSTGRKKRKCLLGCPSVCYIRSPLRLLFVITCSISQPLTNDLWASNSSQLT